MFLILKPNITHNILPKISSQVKLNNRGRVKNICVRGCEREDSVSKFVKEFCYEVRDYESSERDLRGVDLGVRKILSEVRNRV